MDNYIGNVIYHLRSEKGYTQKHLAEDVCSIKQLRRIEANICSPSLFLLSELSNKLGNELFEYVIYSDDPNVVEIKKVVDYINLLFNQHRHSEILSFINNSELLANVNNLYFKQEISWIIGAIDNYIDVKETIDLNYYIKVLNMRYPQIVLDNLLDIFDKKLNPIEYKIINSICVIYLKKLDYIIAKQLLEKAILNYEMNYSKITDTTYVRFIYNLARLNFVLEDYLTAFSQSEKGINYCLVNNNISYLADLFNIHGKSLCKHDSSKDYKKYLNHYISLRRIYNPDLNYEETIFSLKENYDL